MNRRDDLVAEVSRRLAWNLAAYGTAWNGEDEDTAFICAPLIEELERLRDGDDAVREAG